MIKVAQLKKFMTNNSNFLCKIEQLKALSIEHNYNKIEAVKHE